MLLTLKHCLFFTTVVLEGAPYAHQLFIQYQEFNQILFKIAFNNNKKYVQMLIFKTIAFALFEQLLLYA